MDGVQVGRPEVSNLDELLALPWGEMDEGFLPHYAASNNLLIGLCDAGRIAQMLPWHYMG